MSWYHPGNGQMYSRRWMRWYGLLQMEHMGIRTTGIFIGERLWPRLHGHKGLMGLVRKKYQGPLSSTFGWRHGQIITCRAFCWFQLLVNYNYGSEAMDGGKRIHMVAVRYQVSHFFLHEASPHLYDLNSFTQNSLFFQDAMYRHDSASPMGVDCLISRTRYIILFPFLEIVYHENQISWPHQVHSNVPDSWICRPLLAFLLMNVPSIYGKRKLFSLLFSHQTRAKLLTYYCYIDPRRQWCLPGYGSIIEPDRALLLVKDNQKRPFLSLLILRLKSPETRVFVQPFV